MGAVTALVVIAGLGSAASALAAPAGPAVPKLPTTPAGAPRITWSMPARVAGNGYGDLRAVSCLATTDCLAIDRYGDAVTWNGRRWSAPAAAIRGAVGITSLSCPSTAFCAAAGNSLWTGHGTRWTTPVQLLGSWSAVDCESATFCVAGDVLGDVSVFNGKGWSAPTLIRAGLHPISAISCQSARFCAAVTLDGGVGTFNGATWAYATITTGDLSGVSCTSSLFCVAVDETGHAYTFNGTQWSGPGNMQPRADAAQEAVSCASARFCVAVDSLGDATTGT